jgi:hypothetical protein
MILFLLLKKEEGCLLFRISQISMPFAALLVPLKALDESGWT